MIKNFVLLSLCFLEYAWAGENDSWIGETLAKKVMAAVKESGEEEIVYLKLPSKMLPYSPSTTQTRRDLPNLMVTITDDKGQIINQYIQQPGATIVFDNDTITLTKGMRIKRSSTDSNQTKVGAQKISIVPAE